jgi:hypothetical protein
MPLCDAALRRPGFIASGMGDDVTSWFTSIGRRDATAAVDDDCCVMANIRLVAGHDVGWVLPQPPPNSGIRVELNRIGLFLIR